MQLSGGLSMLAHGWVIAASVAHFAAEFFADKIPRVDLLCLLWRALRSLFRGTERTLSP
jgi:hypothetical protein